LIYICEGNKLRNRSINAARFSLLPQLRKGNGAEVVIFAFGAGKFFQQFLATAGKFLRYAYHEFNVEVAPMTS